MKNKPHIRLCHFLKAEYDIFSWAFTSTVHQRIQNGILEKYREGLKSALEFMNLNVEFYLNSLGLIEFDFYQDAAYELLSTTKWNFECDVSLEIGEGLKYILDCN